MANVYTVTEVLHRIKAKLYPNYLSGEGAYIARTANEKVLTVEDICASMKNRGGYAGAYQGAVETVRHYFTEAAYKLGDGYGVDLGLCSVHPNIGGTFNSVRETYDPEKHGVDFRYRPRSMLRKLAQTIAVDIEGIADTHGYVEDFIDVKTGTVNEGLTPGGQFVLTGYKIKAAGTNDAVGVYFAAADGSGEEVKVTERFAKNGPSEIIGTIPLRLCGKTWKIVVKTQFSSGTTTTKEPRVIESGFTLAGCNGDSCTQGSVTPGFGTPSFGEESEAIPAGNQV